MESSEHLLALPSPERLERLRGLADASGVSGFELEVQSLVESYLSQSDLTIEQDAFGNVVARRAHMSSGPHIVIAAHMDEIGFIVTGFNGPFLRFKPVGRWPANQLPGLAVRVNGRGRELFGVVQPTGSETSNLHEVVPLIGYTSLYIDVGAADEAELRNAGVGVGSPVTPHVKAELSNAGACVIGKAWDDRAGLGVLVEACLEAKGRSDVCRFTAIATVQEELGRAGAKAILAREAPKADLIIVLEGIEVREQQTPALARREALGNGACIVVADDEMVAPPVLVDWLTTVASEALIPVQHSIASGTSDAGILRFAGGGTPTCTIGVPCRYIHTSRGLISLYDYQATIALVVAVLAAFRGGGY